MATIDHAHTRLLPPASGGLPTVAPKAGQPTLFDFDSSMCSRMGVCAVGVTMIRLFQCNDG